MLETCINEQRGLAWPSKLEGNLSHMAGPSQTWLTVVCAAKLMGAPDLKAPGRRCQSRGKSPAHLEATPQSAAAPLQPAARLPQLKHKAAVNEHME